MIVKLAFLISCGSDYSVYKADTATTTETVVVDARDAVTERVDILFVVDESCSMAAEQILLKKHASDLVAPLQSDFDQIDWKVGISTADPSDEGAKGWVSYADSDPVNMVGYWLKSLNASCGVYSPDITCEAGFDASMMSFIWDGEHRRDADQLVVFMSDEKEQSSIDTETYLDEVKKQVDYPYDVQHGAIVNLADTSKCMGGMVEKGDGYLDVANIAVDLCDDEHWADTVSFIVSHVREINQYMQLTKLPEDPFDIQVFWSGVQIYDFEYKSDTNQIYFPYPPIPGTHLMAVYQTSETF